MIGHPVPDLPLLATGGRSLRLTDFVGRPVVLYFYPKDNTPGCTREGEQFRDLHDAFAAHRAAILGVSRDSLKSHESFKAKMGFPFDLIADTDEALCAAFGVIKMKTLYGKQVRGIERSTFLIDATGTVRHEWRGVKVPGHAEAVLAALAAL